MVMAIGGLASACTLETPGVEHPLPDSLASALYPGLTASAEDAPTRVNPEVAPDSLIATFGAREVSEAGIIGRIGMAKLRGDEIFVLDDQLNTVHVLDTRTGSHERVGRRGQGPGELAIPRGMALSEDRIYVADERRLIHEGRWSYPAFTDGWFLGLMVSDVVPFLPRHSSERGNVHRRRCEQPGEVRSASVAPASHLRFRPHD